ncbi:MAG: acetate/propionate family kinase [Betaproteobacteria bacterium]|nr:MAG: acetate/propionate family kinase [Betaproteobacteria bacterium]
MPLAILVLNAGSSSLKFSVYSEDSRGLHRALRGEFEGLYTTSKFAAYRASGALADERAWKDGVSLGHDGAIAHLLDFLRDEPTARELAAVGHRVVHGGMDFSSPVRVDAGVLAALGRLVPLAPLHQPHNLAPMRILAERAPALALLACFDTAFHRSQPHVAQSFALPAAVSARGVRRYGFHGLSYEYIATVLPEYEPAAAAGRVVVAHLGNGASLCALRSGRSVATTMGFTPLDGLMMGTRCGTLDPGVVMYLHDELALDTSAIQTMLYRESGLLGVSGISSDMRTLLASDSPRAKEAIDLFVYRFGRELGSLAAALGGIDALVFTAGIGEHAVPIRERVCRDAAWLGVELDTAANDRGGPCISPDGARVSAWVIPTDEELMIARHVRALI